MNTHQLILISILVVLTTVIYVHKTTNKKQPLSKPNIIIPKPQDIDLKPIIPENKPEIPKSEPIWSIYPVVRSVTNLGKVLSDIESHIQAGHQYADNDKVTWAHETTHGINSHIRNKYNQQVSLKLTGGGSEVYAGGRVNAFYCLQDQAAVIEEPNIRLRQVAASVPDSMKGMSFQLYFVQQVSQWDDCPLYAYDEWSAYTNGVECAVDLKIQGRESEIQQAIEFNIYAICLLKVVKTHDPNYDDKQLKSFTMWNIERVMRLHKGEANSHLEAFRSRSDCEALRNFAKDYFGKEWIKILLGVNNE